MQRSVLDYAKDIAYGVSRFPTALQRPREYWGYFTNDENGALQKTFFDELRRVGFRRTPFQLVFPDQTASVVKKVKARADGVNEYHVRFYSDGTIDCELEVSRFDTMHYVGPRQHGTSVLEEILDQQVRLPTEQKERIKGLFGQKKYSETCVRK